MTFAFDCDCALIFSQLKEETVLVEPTVKEYVKTVGLLKLFRMGMNKIVRVEAY